MEETLVAARDGRVPLDAERLAWLLAMTDAIEEAGQRMREQDDLSDSPLVALLGGPPAAAAGPAPAGADGPAPAASGTAPPPRRPRRAGAASPDEPPGIPGPGGMVPPPAKAPAPAAPAAAPAPAPARRPRPGPPSSRRPAGGAAFVRIPAEKIDALLTRSSELLVARLRLESRVEDLIGLREFAGRWNAEWRASWERLRGLLPRDGAPAGRGALAAPRGAGPGPGRREPHPLERDLEHAAAALEADRHQIARAAGRLDEEVRHARMLPFAEACQGLERAVRDVARATGKAVDLAIRGGDVELDRSILEGLKDPLGHLVRNAIDHGLESPEGRRRAGKPPTGRVTVSATLRGAQVEVVVADDGRGLDLEALRQQARRRGLAGPLDERDLADLIFLPGLSTAETVTHISAGAWAWTSSRAAWRSCTGRSTWPPSPAGGRGSRWPCP
jgi:two-component system chemotaxis sensor kinase CheA